MALYVDQRWRGTHGIGRFATEVGDRLDITHQALVASGSPSSPLDAVGLGRMRLSAHDIVYSPGYNAGMTSARQLVTLHDLIHLRAQGPKAMLMNLYYEHVVKPAVLKAGAVFTVSNTSASGIRDWLGDRDGDIDVLNIGNGCSDVFTASTETIQIRDYFLYVGNLKRHKNFDVLLQALVKRPDYKLVAVINDSVTAEQKVSSLGLDNRVQIISGLSDFDLAGYYRSSIGLLMPSLIEGFGLPAVESLACGRPVAFASQCLSVAEIVGDFGVAVNDPTAGDEWAAAMDKLASLSQNFKAPSDDWRSQYRWDQVASRIEAHLFNFRKV